MMGTATETGAWVDPKPRDFQLGVFKCRSMLTGTLPNSQDLFRHHCALLDRSNMPQWSTFTKQQRADLVAWVKHFSPRWASEKPEHQSRFLPNRKSLGSASRPGRDVFAKVQCWCLAMVRLLDPHR